MLISIQIFGLIMTGATSQMMPEEPPTPPSLTVGTPGIGLGVEYIINPEWREYRRAMARHSQENIDVINDTMFIMLIGSVVLVMAVSKSGTWAKQILDAS